MMSKLIGFLILAALCYSVVAVTKNEAYKTVHSVGEAIRQKYTSELRQAISETKSKASDPQERMCIDSQTSGAYKELNSNLGHELNELRKYYKAQTEEDVAAISQAQLQKEVHQRASAAVESFGETIDRIRACVVSES